MSKTVEDLREHLFETIAGLRAGTMDIERAKTISDVAQTIINSAKVEVEAARIAESAQAPKFLGGAEPALPKGINGIVRHRLQG